MRVGVPGEFHEDRWQRTAEDSERCMLPRTREVGWTHRIQVIEWRRGSSDRSLAQLPCPQVPQCHPRVAKGASGRSSARLPCPQAPSRRGEGGFRPLFGTGTMRTSTPEAFRRGEGDIYRPFGTGTLNRTTSGVEARGKTVWNRCQTGLLPMLRPDFGTASPARGLSVASWRGEAVIYWLFVHKMPLFHGH